MASLDEISIKSIRQVIRKLIDQGHDKACPDRLDDQQLLVVMAATIRHMPLVTQLLENTRIITKEIRHFQTVVKTIVNQVKVIAWHTLSDVCCTVPLRACISCHRMLSMILSMLPPG
jgi:hypothetical protein